MRGFLPSQEPEPHRKVIASRLAHTYLAIECFMELHSSEQLVSIDPSPSRHPRTVEEPCSIKLAAAEIHQSRSGAGSACLMAGETPRVSFLLHLDVSEHVQYIV